MPTTTRKLDALIERRQREREAVQALIDAVNDVPGASDILLGDEDIEAECDPDALLGDAGAR